MVKHERLVSAVSCTSTEANEHLAPQRLSGPRGTNGVPTHPRVQDEGVSRGRHGESRARRLVEGEGGDPGVGAVQPPIRSTLRGEGEQGGTCLLEPSAVGSLHAAVQGTPPSPGARSSRNAEWDGREREGQRTNRHLGPARSRTGRVVTDERTHVSIRRLQIRSRGNVLLPRWEKLGTPNGRAASTNDAGNQGAERDCAPLDLDKPVWVSGAHLLTKVLGSDQARGQARARSTSAGRGRVHRCRGFGRKLEARRATERAFATLDSGKACQRCRRGRRPPIQRDARLREPLKAGPIASHARTRSTAPKPPE